MIMMNKFDYEAKQNHEKKDNERKKNILILIIRFLINLGFGESAFKLQEEANLDLDKFEVADNIDLYIIVREYEEYFEMKFNKKPKFVNKLDQSSCTNVVGYGNSNLPKIKGRDSKTLGNGTADKKTATASQSIKSKRNDIPNSSMSSKSTTGDNKAEPEELKLELIGNPINIIGKANKNKDDNSKFTFNDQKESILLKPLPANLPEELKDLACLVKREIIIENPNVTFDDIIGLNVPKTIIKEALLLPMKFPQFFTGILEPWKGILLFGPPGTGKTLLAKAVATEMRCTFFNMSAATIVSKWRGDSEKIIKVLFDLARHYQPSTIFLDEIDSIMSKRGNSLDEHEGSRRMKTELLIQLDGLCKNEGVFLLAASNIPWDLDSALLRRLEKRVLVNLPEEASREAMLKKFIPMDKHKDIDYTKWAKVLEGYSGSDIRLVCKEALMKGVRRAIAVIEKEKTNVNTTKIDITLSAITNDDLQEAMEQTKPASMYKSEHYLKWMETFGSA